MPATAPESAPQPASTPDDSENPEGRLRLALEAFYARSARREQPDGEWRDRLWYPSQRERQACCEGIVPTLDNRQALDSHCRTQVHVAALYGVSVADLKAAVRAERKLRASLSAPAAVAASQSRRPASGQALYELSLKSRNEGLDELRQALEGCLPLFERLRSEPSGEDLPLLLEEALAGAKRLFAAIDYTRTLEASVRFSQAVLTSLRALEDRISESELPGAAG